jgi:GNAT superfamily N-acetyltransferase
MNKPDEIVALLSSSKRGSGFVTNCFLQEPAIRALAANGLLEAFCFSGGTCLLRREDTFRRLYFFAPGFEALRDALSGLSLPPGELITDVVGRTEQAEPVAAALVSAGFSSYKDFQRMARLGGELPPPKNAAQAEAEFAVPEDSSQVQELIAASFDPRAEHLPTLLETAEAVAQRCVLVARCGPQTAAVLFFSRAGMATILRFWLVRAEFRGMGLGDLLVRRYFAECVACRRFTLWVHCGNDQAIRRYQDYGYRPDGAIDRIMRKVR